MLGTTFFPRALPNGELKLPPLQCEVRQLVNFNEQRA
jgi:hypothetical protein